MKQFWESVVSDEPTLAQMTHYPNPADISGLEIPEVLSLLPDIHEKDILDLGAGIGQVLYRVVCQWWNLWCSVQLYYTVSQKKQDTILLSITLPNISLFSKFFTVRLSSKFVIESCLNMPPHLKHAATLPCEMYVLKNHHAQQVIEPNCHVRLSHSENFF